MMERLTERTDIGIVGNNATVKNYPLYKVAEYDELDHGITGQCFNKLAEYEDAEEQGLLLRLPLKIGDTVYSVTRDFISEYTICSIEKYYEGLFFNWRCEKGMYVNLKGFTEYDIGKTVFLTQAEAEHKLKEMESD